MSAYDANSNGGNDSEQLRENEFDDRPTLRLHQRGSDRYLFSEVNRVGAWIATNIDGVEEVRR